MPIPENIYRAAGNGNLELVRAYFAAGDRDPNDLSRTGLTRASSMKKSALF